MSQSDIALSVFRQAPLRLNCAQSVCHAAGRADLLEPMAICGGGRAEQGLCGALYGAMKVVGTQREQAVYDAFMRECGAVTCRELKAGQKVSCERCVSLAAQLL